MANSIETIKTPIREEMKLFEKKFYEALRSEVSLLDKVMKFIVTTKGKQIRPILVLLSARLVGEVNEKTYRGASMIELIHTATLVHDDVVDDSHKRRGFFSINALWKNKIAVLVGDYLLSKLVILSTENQDFEILGVVSKTIREMSEGELLQLEKSRKLDITEEVYFEIIRKKTATLLAACCQIGGISNDINKETAEELWELGICMGMVFQMKDDLLDYSKKNIIGKPVGNDIKEQKMTLPLIFTLKQCKPEERKYYFGIIKKHHQNAEKVRELIDFVKEKGGLDYATQKMREYQQKAKNILQKFPDNEARKSLELLLEYVIERNK